MMKQENCQSIDSFFSHSGRLQIDQSKFRDNSSSSLNSRFAGERNESENANLNSRNRVVTNPHFQPKDDDITIAKSGPSDITDFALDFDCIIL